MEKKEEKIFRDIVKILEQDVPQEALAEGNPTPEQEAIALIKQELDKAREEGKKEYLKEVELMQRFSSRKEVDLTRDEAFKRLVRLLKSKLKDNK